MNFIEYQMKAMSFRLASADRLYALLNLSAEVGEVLSLKAKLIRDGGDVEEHRVKLMKELGDVLWHIAAIAEDNGLELIEIAEQNIHKLESRYRRGVVSGSGDAR